MPGHGLPSSRNFLKLEEYPLEYHTLSREENITKYQQFQSWCNTCGKSSYKQVPNECVEPCKKKSKETKTCVKKYLDNEQFENMELDYQLKEGWYDTKKQFSKPYECCRFSSLNGADEQQYYDCCRFRPNLCELPTSYIRNTNNCQPNQALSCSKMSDDGKEYVECLENRVKSYEKAIKYVEYSENASVLQVDHEKIRDAYDGRLQKTCEKLAGIHSHFNPIISSERSDELKQTKNNIGHSYSLEVKSNPRNISDNQFSDFRNVNDKDKYCQTEPCFCTDDSGSNHFYNCSIHYETQTYFDKNSQDSRKPNISSIYAQEMENLKEKLKELRNSAYKNSTSAEMVAESLVAKDKESEEKACRIMNKESPKVIRRTKTRLIRVKTRGRVANTIKVRRTNTKSTLSSRTSSIELEDSHSDYSGSDESLKEMDEDSQVSDNVPTESTKNGTARESVNVVENIGSGDSAVWPLRESLFPNVPPYISFNSFNAEVPRRMPIGRKFFKWKLSTITPIVVRKVLSNSGFALVRKSNQWLGTWGKHIKSPMFKTLKIHQKLNHFPGTFQLGRKDRLWRNFQRMINNYGLKEFGFLPYTYVLPQELKLLKYNWENKNTGGEWFIIKPPASARGVGIKVINKWAQLPKKTSLVVQKYIANPYLINGSKFDLRLYVLVTSFNPLRVYLYSEGLVRFASVKYSNNPKDIKEKYMHLTNYSINKLSSNYTANDDAHSTQGHKWTITKLLEYLSHEGVDTNLLWKNLEMLVVKTMIACEQPISELCSENMNTRYNCYELFGIDVLLDDKLKPWLLEVNISPSLHSSSPLDEHVKGPLVQALFNMVQFHFPSKLAPFVKPHLKCFESKMYTANLTQRETNKHSKFTNMLKREEYLEAILENLTGDDVRHLIQAEDELTVKEKFVRIFPTSSSHKLLDFMPPRYYNRLFDAWETKYHNNREKGIQRLQVLCAQRVHMKGATISNMQKNGQTTNHGVKTPATKEPSPPRDTFSINKMFSDATGIHQELPLVPSTQ
ncbi:tubulin polyglutamylase TTLL4-like isoform X2 [Coccinella septempunctata]|uniref:tubulin polyglutamylase TTLL4-like isoform X2 n=1 Tax=Coccinella septempunctata TaxID=41139 RepID=UPI001D08CEA9|nr:tubulin polyglutamylase TTLL4-like isoform X2 [Coccinella septempunctata]